MSLNSSKSTKEVFRCPTPPPVVNTIYERLPTPEAEVIERVVIKKKPRRIIEKIIEKPRKPSPIFIEREVFEEEPEPIVRTQVVSVSPTAKQSTSMPHSINNNSNNNFYSFQPAMSNNSYTCHHGNVYSYVNGFWYRFQ
jgi:hypothetical protein